MITRAIVKLVEHDQIEAHLSEWVVHIKARVLTIFRSHILLHSLISLILFPVLIILIGVLLDVFVVLFV